MRCLLDKVTARRILEGLLKLLEARELTEDEFTGMMEFVMSEEFDQMYAPEFFGTLKAMDMMDAPERVLVKGRIEGDRFIDRFIPHCRRSPTAMQLAA